MRYIKNNDGALREIDLVNSSIFAGDSNRVKPGQFAHEFLASERIFHKLLESPLCDALKISCGKVVNAFLGFLGIAKDEFMHAVSICGKLPDGRKFCRGGRPLERIEFLTRAFCRRGSLKFQSAPHSLLAAIRLPGGRCLWV